MVLTPRIVDTVKIPVVTVGGIADGRSVAAALTLGAEGVMMASRFIATKECVCHDNIKKELINRQEYETILFGKSIGLQGRALKNKNIMDILAIEAKGGGLEELIPLMGGERIKNSWDNGDIDYAPLMVGQSIGFIKDIPTVQELLDRMAAEAVGQLEKTRKKLSA
jgi:nitronate monooxygenase